LENKIKESSSNLSVVSSKVQELRVELQNKISFLDTKKNEFQELENSFAPNRNRQQSVQEELDQRKLSCSEKETLLSNLRKQLEFSNNPSSSETN
jgi:ABC-type dipeptide/oligopeptide/nickel transport system ATPase subunit